MKDSMVEKIKEGWRGNRIHGQLSGNLDKKNCVYNKQSYRWLKFGDIKGEQKVY